MRNREKIKKPKTDYQLLEEINGLCLHLAQTMDTVSNKIERIDNIFLPQNIVSFPPKGMRKA